jgi:hypothetical protein
VRKTRVLADGQGAKMPMVFEEILSGGHPNSLGRTVDVVEIVLADPDRLGELFDTYGSTDPVVRLRVSSAFKRIAQQRPELLVPEIDRLLYEPGEIDQPSARWTFALLMGMLVDHASPEQRERALEIIKRDLEESDDWIVQNTTMQVLADWAAADEALAAWLRPRLERFAESPRKSVAGRARKLLVNPPAAP